MIIDKSQRKITSKEIQKVNRNLESISLKLLFVVMPGACSFVSIVQTNASLQNVTERHVRHVKLFNNHGRM